MSPQATTIDRAEAYAAFTPMLIGRGTTGRAYFVELVGLPGAGKSTVARAAANQLRSAGVLVAEDDLPPLTGIARIQRYARFASFCARHPRLVGAVARYTLAVRPWSLARLRFAFGVLTHAFGAVEARRRHGIVLLSQGMLQAAWSIAVNGTLPNARVVEALVDALMPAYEGGAIVHVDVDPAQAAARIAARGGGGSRFDGLSEAEALARLRPLSRHLATILDSATDRASCALLRVDGCSPPEENAAAVAALVQELRPAAMPSTTTDASAPAATADPSRRVAVFIPSMEVGGAERIVLNLCSGFIRRGLAVDLLLIHRVGIYLAEVPPEVRIITLSGRRALFAIPALARYLRRERPEALLATLTYANIAAVIARRIAGVATRVTVREANTLTRAAESAPELKDRQLPRAARWFYPWADAIIAVSSGAADGLVEATGMSRELVHVLDNPIITDDVATLAAEPVDHPWLTTARERPVIVAAGRLTPQKDFPTLLRAFALLRKRREARLLILGDGELRHPLEQLARDLGIAEDVSLPGVVRNPFSYMARASVFVVSSAWEGSPGVLIQAMASGAPVVATDCESGPREILRDGEFGPLVTVGDAAGLAAAIETVLAAPRRSPPAISWQRFSTDAAVDAYLRVLGVC